MYYIQSIAEMDFIFLNSRVKHSFQIVMVLCKNTADAITRIGPFIHKNLTYIPTYTYIIK